MSSLLSSLKEIKDTYVFFQMVFFISFFHQTVENNFKSLFTRLGLGILHSYQCYHVIYVILSVFHDTKIGVGRASLNSLMIFYRVVKYILSMHGNLA